MTTNKNEQYTDFIIKQVIQENMKNAPEMPYSEDETWHMIQKRIKNESPKKWQGGKLTKLSLIAASIIIAFSFVQVQSGDAFGWLTKYVFKSQGTLTGIESSNQASGSEEKGIPSPNELEILPSVTTTELMNLPEAQKVTAFKIIVPHYVPEGYSLQDVVVVREGEKKSNEITLNFKNAEETLKIRQTTLAEEYGDTFVVDNEDTIVKKVDIFNQEASFLTFKDGSTILFWNNMQLRFEIDSHLSEEEVLKIAHSM